MIKILRLSNGEDIIGNAIEQYVGQYIVSEPMSVDIDYHSKEAGLIMHHWLPIQLIDKNEVQLEPKDVLCVMEPNNEFREYYLNTVEKIKDLLKAKNLVDSLDDDEVNDIMDAFDELNLDGTTLH